MERLDVALLPSEALAITADCYVVVDVLRATTTIATLFAHGLARLTCADDIERARSIASERGALLFGEVQGLPPTGFDHGNSPLGVHRSEVDGREAVLFTTNGTTTLCALAGRGLVYAGAIANAAAVAIHAARHARIAIVCSGTDRSTRVTLEDVVAAGVIARALLRAEPRASVGDGARLALDAATGGVPTEQLLAAAEHAAALRRLGLGADVTFAAQPDTSRAVPVMTAYGDGWTVLEDQATPGATVSA